MTSSITTTQFLNASDSPETLQTSSKRFPAIPLTCTNNPTLSFQVAAPSMAELAQPTSLDGDKSPSSFEAVLENRFWDSPLGSEKLFDQDDNKNVSALPSSIGSASSGSSNEPPKSSITPSMSRIHEFAFLIVVCLAQFLSLGALNQTVAPVMILARFFHIHDYGTLSWFSAAYSMTVGTFILPAGRLGDMYGHKRVFLIGWAWFCIWSLITGFCYKSGVILFSICRAFQGMGPALLVPNAIALIGRTFPIGIKRNTAFACFGAAGPTGATAGAFFAALLAQLAWWPWSFWILSIVCLCVMFLSYLIIPSEKRSVSADRPTFDYLGCVTGVTGLVLINFALNQAPLIGWGEPYIPTLLVLGFLSMAAFVWVELYFTSHPLIPIRGLQLDAAFALACIAAGWGSHGIWAYYLYLFLEHLRGHSALLTSAETSPVAITGVFFAFSTVWLLRRIPVSSVMLIAMVFFMVGSLLMATTPLHQTYWAQTFLSIVLMPGAMNLSFPAATILLSSALPKEKQGIAVAGSINRYTIQRASNERGLQGHPAPLAVTTPEVVAARLEGLRCAYWFAVGLGALGVLIAGVFIFVTKKRARAEGK